MGKQKIKNTLITAGCVTVALMAGIVFVMDRAAKPIHRDAFIVGNAPVYVEIADTAVTQQKGLSGRAHLPLDQGMLFVFSDKKVRHFWMPDMHFSLDALWIADMRVVAIEEDIAPTDASGEITRFISPEPVDMVLEVNQGWVGRNGVKIGDMVMRADEDGE